MKSIRNVDVLYTIHEKSRVLEECICRVESACDTGHFESVDSALRTKPELRAALGTYIRQLLALLGMLTPQAYSTASLDVRDVQDLLQALQREPDKASAFWPDLSDAYGAPGRSGKQGAGGEVCEDHCENGRHIQQRDRAWTELLFL